mgnify:CR=1 FL=1
MQEFIERIPNSSGGRKSTKKQWEQLNEKLHKVKDGFTNNPTTQSIKKILKFPDEKILREWIDLNYKYYGKYPSLNLNLITLIF